MPGLWQIAAGTSDRDFRKLFLDHDLMLIGPGNPGPAPAEIYRGRGIMGTIGSFAADPEPGDPILLRIGQEVVAIGHISNDEGYSWDERFDDVLGWDLQHCRRVQWEPGLMGDFARGDERKRSSENLAWIRPIDQPRFAYVRQSPRPGVGFKPFARWVEN